MERLRDEIAPAEAGKPCEVPVRRPPFASVFDGERGKVGVGGVRAANAGTQDQVLEDRPVPRTRRDPPHLRLGPKGIHEREHLGGRGGLRWFS